MTPPPTAVSPVLSGKSDPITAPSPSSVSRRYSKTRGSSGSVSPSLGPVTSGISGLSLGPSNFYRSKSFGSQSSISGSGHTSDGESGANHHPHALPKTSIFLDNRLPSEYFKQDILKIIHRLRIHRWSKYVAPEMAKDLQVTRISGALTNAVYCVAPPTYIRDVIKMAHKASVIAGVDQHTGHPVPFAPETNAIAREEVAEAIAAASGPNTTSDDSGYVSSISVSSSAITKKVPPKLLLRVYGPHVENLIDRQSELNVLSRLSRRHIGPKLLGIFANGRFEQFLEATTLTKDDVRDPDVSVQIAKRMRELHDLVKLEEEKERALGSCAFTNISKWIGPAREKLIALQKQPQYRGKNIFKEILGTETFDEFEAAIEKYKHWLEKQYSPQPNDPKALALGQEQIKKELVFSHNDTQYGNLLRILPPPGSPLLSPAFEHRQIVVIDFEYSGANTRGYDIVNHFCEWMSDYLSAEQPWKIHHEKYPTRAQRRNLIQGYAEHGYSIRAKQGGSNSVFFDDDAIEAEVEALERESMNWRAAVSVHWAIWGLVQAVIDASADAKIREEMVTPEGYKFEDATKDEGSDEDDAEEEEDAFDYVLYAKEKIDLFWGDLIKLGIFTPETYTGPYVQIANDE